jgi:hydrogenase maturation protein HypF
VSDRVRRNVRVEGVVQGVGFRPFVYGLAGRTGVAGRVGNDVHGVFVEIEGTPAQVDAFLTGLVAQAPPLAAIERVTTSAAPPTGAAGFTIAASDAAGERHTLVSADSATCDDCLRELFDPDDRRYRYPFINCTNCGPRFTIVRDVPYDRPLTTMAGFTMCPPNGSTTRSGGWPRSRSVPTTTRSAPRPVARCATSASPSAGARRRCGW